MKNNTNKGKMIPLILCLIMGNFGVHRFYMGKWKSGLIMLGLYLIFPPATGIWMIVDLVKIIKGSLIKNTQEVGANTL